MSVTSLPSLYTVLNPDEIEDGYESAATASLSPSPSPVLQEIKNICTVTTSSGSSFCKSSTIFSITSFRKFVKISEQEPYIGSFMKNTLRSFKDDGIVDGLITRLYGEGNNINKFIVGNVVKSYCDVGLDLFAAEIKTAQQQCINIGLPPPSLPCSYNMQETYPELENGPPIRSNASNTAKLWESRTWCTHCWLCGLRVEDKEKGDLQLNCEHILPYITGSIFLKTARGGTPKKPAKQTLHTKREYGQSHSICNGLKNQGEFIKFDFVSGKIIPDLQQINNFITELTGINQATNKQEISDPPIKSVFEEYSTGGKDGQGVGAASYRDVAITMNSTIVKVIQKLCDDSLNLRESADLPSPVATSITKVGPSQRVIGALIFSCILNYIINKCVVSGTGLTIMDALKGDGGEGTKNMFVAPSKVRKEREGDIKSMFAKLQYEFANNKEIVINDLLSAHQNNPLAKEIHATHLAEKLLQQTSFGRVRVDKGDQRIGRTEGMTAKRKNIVSETAKQGRYIKSAAKRVIPELEKSFKLKQSDIEDALIFSGLDVIDAYEVGNIFFNLLVALDNVPEFKIIIAELLLNLPNKTYGTDLYHLDIKTLYNNIITIIKTGFTNVAQENYIREQIKTALRTYNRPDTIMTPDGVRIDLVNKLYAIHIYYFILKDLNERSLVMSFGKKTKFNKIKHMPIEQLKSKLKSIGINVTKITRSGKRLPLTRKELERKANLFKNLQLRAKKMGIKIMYKSRTRGYVYKSYNRLMNEIEKTKTKTKRVSKFG